MNRSTAFLKIVFGAVALLSVLTTASSQPFVGPGPVSLTANPAGLPAHMEIVLAPSVGGRPSQILYYGPADDTALKGQYGVLTTYLIGRDWDDENFTGSLLEWTTTNSERCRNGTYVYQAATYPSGWDNRVSSAVTGYGTPEEYKCYHFKHYQNTSYSGWSVDCHSNCQTMGLMNNATSSSRIYR
jgi:hypothetical protein